MKNLYFVAAALAAFAFTACSDDDKKSDGACYFSFMIPKTGDVCGEGKEASSQSKCNEMLKGMEGYTKAEYKEDGCPEKADLECPVMENGKKVGTLYGYGNYFTNGTMDCKDLIGE